MKFLLDMGLARSTATFLRTQGYNAVHLREEGWQRLADEKIIEKARNEDRVILTHDLDFGRLIALSQRQFPQCDYLSTGQHAANLCKPLSGRNLGPVRSRARGWRISERQ